MITTSGIDDTLIVSLAGEHRGTTVDIGVSSGSRRTDPVNFLSALRDPGAFQEPRQRKTTGYDRSRALNQRLPSFLPKEEKPRIDDETIATHCRCSIALEDLSFRVANSRRQRSMHRPLA